MLVFLYCVAQVGVLEPALTFKTSSCSQTSILYHLSYCFTSHFTATSHSTSFLLLAASLHIPVTPHLTFSCPYSSPPFFSICTSFLSHQPFLPHTNALSPVPLIRSASCGLCHLMRVFKCTESSIHLPLSLLTNCIGIGRE